MESVLRELVDDDLGLVLLLAPPSDKDPRWPGYIRAYPPGVRENGGQYTHAGTWVGFALAALGRGDDAFRVFRYLCPISRTVTPEDARRDRFQVVNPEGVRRGVRAVEVDGKPIPGDHVPLPEDGEEHHVRVVMGR